MDFCKIHYLFQLLFCLIYDLFFCNVFKCFSNCFNLLSFKDINQTYLLKVFITNNKTRILLLYLLTNCIAARSAAHMLSARDEYTLWFWNFLMIGFCNSLANCLWDVIVVASTVSARITAPLSLLSKVCQAWAGAYDYSNAVWFKENSPIYPWWHDANVGRKSANNRRWYPSTLQCTLAFKSSW